MRSIVVGIFAACLCLQGTEARAIMYSITEIGTFGGAVSNATGINNQGQVVGTATYPNGDSHAFFYSGGALQDLGTLGGDQSYGAAINDSGMAAGTSYVSGSFPQHAFLYDGSQLKDLGTLPNYPTESGGSGINNSGDVVGTSSSGIGFVASFLYSGGPLQQLPEIAPSPFLNGATDINSSGQIVGESSALTNGSSSVHPFLLTGGIHGVLTDLGVTGAANALNDSGIVVGRMSIAGSIYQHAFLYTGGSPIDLGTIANSTNEKARPKTSMPADKSSVTARQQAAIRTPFFTREVR